MADVRCGVKYISKERSGCPRCSCSGSGATRRKARAVSSASRYVGLTASTLKTRSSEEDERPGHQSGDEWVEDDENAPLQLDLVRVHVAVDV